MTRTTYRVLLLLLGIGFIGVVVGALFLAPEGSPRPLPEAVDRIEPADGELVFAQPEVLLDLAPGYRAAITIDGIAVPGEQVIWTEATGLHVFRPGPGKVIEVWTPGLHLVEAAWDGTPGHPDPGSLSWAFRVQ
jgi:hypothetical protein